MAVAVAAADSSRRSIMAPPLCVWNDSFTLFMAFWWHRKQVCTFAQFLRVNYQRCARIKKKALFSRDCLPNVTRPPRMAPCAIHTYTQAAAHVVFKSILHCDSGVERLDEMDGAVMTAVCTCLFMQWRMTAFCFLPSLRSLWYSAPRNRRRAILFPSVIFNEHTSFIYSQRRETKEGRKEGGKEGGEQFGTRPTKRKSNERKLLFFFLNNGKGVRGEGMGLKRCEGWKGGEAVRMER